MPQCDPWRFPTLVLWLFFFGLGISPEAVYYFCRATAYVTTQHAFVNSPWMIFFGLVAYLGLFSFRRCREAGLDDSETHGKTLQIMLLALPAFLPFRPELALHYSEIPVPHYRWLVLGIATVKLLTWLYLLSVLLRYYLGWGAEVYRQMPSVFPSMHHVRQEKPAVTTLPQDPPGQQPPPLPAENDNPPSSTPEGD